MYSRKEKDNSYFFHFAFCSFTIFDFFPNTDTESLAWSILCPFHEGLAEWDEPYNDHLWIMHSIISQVGIYVNALMVDRIDTKPVYEVATQLSLYRIYELVGGNWTSVSSENWTNQLNERFEHHCPPRWIISGVHSNYNDVNGDEQWKFGCRLVDWIERYVNMNH